MKLKALIVEDKSYYQALLETLLSDIGIDCVIFSSGRDALEATHKAEYDFILVSQDLEDIGGELFLLKYKAKFSIDAALTILTTSEEMPDNLLKANQAGFKLVVNTKDFIFIQTLLSSIVNNKTLDLDSDILYIEDQKSVAAMTVAIFANYPAHIDHVTNLAEAKEKFSEKNYDLVITDYYLEDNETGEAVIEFIRGYDHPDKSHTPILVVSGESDSKKRTTFLRSGANDFLTKPFDEDELVVRSSNLIHNKRMFQQVQKQKQELLELAMTDQLTGIYNRHSLFDFGPKYISDAKRQKYSISLFVFDLDHFKSVNDTYGHSVGDVVLKDIGQVLNKHCRNEDIVARFGGEEFVMLLSHCNLEDAKVKAEEIRLAIENARPNDLKITASIGVAALNKEDDFESLFEKADKAVYEAKETGRNKVVIYADKIENAL